MRKVVVAAGVLIGVGIVAKRLGSMCQNMDCDRVFAAMPDNAPPKRMFRDITAIRENTERIIEMLEGSARGVVREAPPGEGTAP